MRSFTKSLRLVAVVATLGLSIAGVLSFQEPAGAQVEPGEYGLYQPGQNGVVGWVCASSDHTKEWWAYIDGAYAWAGVSSTPQNRWHLEAERTGSGDWSSFAAWKSAVLARPAAQGKKVVFQNHSVAEETVQN